MILMADVAISGSSSGDRDGGSDNGNGGNGHNGYGSGRNGNSVDGEGEQIRGMDSEEIILAAVELGMGVTAEDIWYEGNCLCFSLGLSTGFSYYSMSTP
jgi:hypothetical protein